MMGHLFNVAHNAIREHAKRHGGIASIITGEAKRSSRWPAVERAYRLTHPVCAACSGDIHLNVHHKRPFHLAPALELDTKNLITLCMGPLECHLKIGHGGNFKAFNPDVEEDAQEVLASRWQYNDVCSRALAKRKFVLAK